MRIVLKLVTIEFFAVLIVCGVSYATTITSVATDLTDTAAGEDLWQIEYTVSDYTFNADQGFTIWFDLGLYEELTIISAGSGSDWDVLVWNPDSSIPDDGAYDALALVDNASLDATFIVSFVWLGSEVPNTQSFDVYELSYDGYYTTIESGQTSSPVPEPGTIILAAIGFIGLARFGRSSRNIC